MKMNRKSCDWEPHTFVDLREKLLFQTPYFCFLPYCTGYLNEMELVACKSVEMLYVLWDKEWQRSCSTKGLWVRDSCIRLLEEADAMRTFLQQSRKLGRVEGGAVGVRNRSMKWFRVNNIFCQFPHHITYTPPPQNITLPSQAFSYVTPSNCPRKQCR